MLQINYKPISSKTRKKYIVHRVPSSNDGWIHLKLGELYYYGIDGEPDLERALTHFKNAAANGIEEANQFLDLLKQSP